MNKKILRAMLSPALFILAATLAVPAFPADDSAGAMTGAMTGARMGPKTVAKTEASATGTANARSTTDMEILRQKVRADKKYLVANNMKLTETEAKAFWPLYEAYQKDLQGINQQMTKVISDYAAAYNKGAILNDTAQKLLDDSIAIEVAEVKLKQSYVPKLSKILPAAKVARYIQIENKIRALVRYTLAEAIPLVE